MRGRCSADPMPPAQAGAALLVGLVLVTAVGLLSAAAMREVTLEAAKTGHLAARVQARLSAASAIDMAVAADALPQSGETTVHYRLGPNAAWEADVTIRHLGVASAPGGDAMPDTPGREYFEIVAAIDGPRGARERRRLIWKRPMPDGQ